MAERDLIEADPEWFESINNLNNLIGRTDDRNISPPVLADWGLTVRDCKFDSVSVVFKDVEQTLVNIINKYQECVIFGCVAWLTSELILRTLAKCTSVQIIVQKEDFLRPDSNSGFGWKEKLRKLYKNIKFRAARWELDDPLCELSRCADPTVDAIRCVGNFNFQKKSAFPRSHHKFLVFCEVGDDVPNRTFIYKPKALWTGSYNMTHNATKSLENGLFIENKDGSKIFDAYLKEHHDIFCMSESLDWETPWSSPEYRIGT